MCPGAIPLGRPCTLPNRDSKLCESPPRWDSRDVKDVSLPHPRGMIETSYRQNAEFMDATIKLPDGLTGVFAWENVEHTLHAGTQTFHFRARATSGDISRR